MSNRSQMLIEIAHEAQHTVLWMKQFIATLNTVLVDQRLEQLIMRLQEFLALFSQSPQGNIPLESRIWAP